MKFIAILIIALIATTLTAVKITSHSKVKERHYKERVLSLHSQGSYTGLLLDAIQLHLKLKGPFQQIFSLLDDIIADLRDQLEEIATLNERYSSIEETEFRNYQSIMDDASHAIDAHTQQIINDHETLIQAQSDLAINQQAEATAITDQEEEDARFTKEQDDFDEKIQEHNDDIDAIETVRPAINSLNFDYRTPLDAGDESFIQVHKSVQKVAQRLEKTAKSHYKPLIAALIEMTANSEYFANPEVVNKILELFDDLLNQLTESKNDLLRTQVVSIEFHDQKMAALKDAETNAHEAAISNQQTIDDTENDIVYHTEKLDEERARYADAQRSLEDLENWYNTFKDWSERKSEEREHDLENCIEIRSILEDLDAGSSDFFHDTLENLSSQHQEDNHDDDEKPTLGGEEDIIGTNNAEEGAPSNENAEAAGSNDVVEDEQEAAQIEGGPIDETSGFTQLRHGRALRSDRTLNRKPHMTNHAKTTSKYRR